MPRFPRSAAARPPVLRNWQLPCSIADMVDWILVAGIIWMMLAAAVIFLALGRISAAMQDQHLRRAGIGDTDPLHLHLRHVIRSEDRIGISLTLAVAICTVILASMLADQVLRSAIHRFVQILSF